MIAKAGAAVTFQTALHKARKRLAETGIETAALDARVLMEWASGLGPSDLLRLGDREIETIVSQRFEAAIKQRIAGKPCGRITGRRSFWTLDLKLSTDTLEPRPDTELLVEKALAEIDRRKRRLAPLRIVDIGVGSGAILLALLSECPKAVGIGIDIATGALTTARENAEAHGLQDRCLFVQGDFGAAAHLPSIDILVSNPPYLAHEEFAALTTEVARHDPRLALDGGADGLAAYRAILSQARLGLPKLGIWLEIGATQGDTVLAMGENLTAVGTLHRDLANLPRCVEFIPHQ